MDLFQYGTTPWGQEVLIRISWDLLYLAFWAGVAFIIFHLIYAAVWLPKIARASRGSAGHVPDTMSVPEKITRHTLAARLFHWVMAAAMLTLIITGFFPIVGIQFPWITIHWVAGVALAISILYHIVHATFFLDFRSIWIFPSDLKEAWARTKRQMGQQSAEIPKHGKYPLDHKLYHMAVTVAGLAVVGTGIAMLPRVETLLGPPDPYIFTDATWGVIYVLHDLGAVLFVTLTLTHIYFAVRPDKLWLTKSMVFGDVDRDRYLKHHDPRRWVVPRKSTES